MHLATYSNRDAGRMLAHYRRDESSLGRDNIDPKRVKNDMVVAHYTNKDGKLVVGRVVPREGEPNWGTVERRIERVNEAQKAAGKRATRKDAVVMADVVVTLPDNVRSVCTRTSLWISTRCAVRSIGRSCNLPRTRRHELSRRLRKKPPLC